MILSMFHGQKHDPWFLLSPTLDQPKSQSVFLRIQWMWRVGQHMSSEKDVCRVAKVRQKQKGPRCCKPHLQSLRSKEGDAALHLHRVQSFVNTEQTHDFLAPSLPVFVLRADKLTKRRRHDQCKASLHSSQSLWLLKARMRPLSPACIPLSECTGSAARADSNMFSELEWRPHPHPHPPSSPSSGCFTAYEKVMRAAHSVGTDRIWGVLSWLSHVMDVMRNEVWTCQCRYKTCLKVCIFAGQKRSFSGFMEAKWVYTLWWFGLIQSNPAVWKWSLCYT